jgi:hypothetical protein
MNSIVANNNEKDIQGVRNNLSCELIKTNKKLEKYAFYIRSVADGYHQRREVDEKSIYYIKKNKQKLNNNNCKLL